MMRVVYVIGVPGVGKTTVVEAALADLAETRTPVELPVPHERLDVGGVAVGAHLGKRRAGFGGTDALAMNIQPRVVEWLSGQPYPLILAEGDRLANAKFFRAITALGLAPTVVRLVVDPPDLVWARRQARGSNQNVTWLRGRQTKVERLNPWVTAVIDNTGPPEIAGRALAELCTVEVTA